MKFMSNSLVLLCLSTLPPLVGAQTPPALADMLAKNACTACHAVDKKVVGPAFKDVAAKYRNDKDAAAKLIAKVKSGGSGVWGPIPMPPQAAKEEDVRLIVKQILQLK